MINEYNPLAIYRKWGQYMTSPYGYRTGTYSGFHNGIDIGGIPCNGLVKTPYGGRVRMTTGYRTGTWGKIVVLEIAKGLLQLTAHHNGFRVKVGDYVNAGDVIALNGGTNNTAKSYACHIHYEIRIDDGTRPVGGKVWGDPVLFNPEIFEVDYGTEPSIKFKSGMLIKNMLLQSSLNIRSMPGTYSSIVGKLRPQETARIITDKDNGIYRSGYFWWKIDKGGWIAEVYIQML